MELSFFSTQTTLPETSSTPSFKSRTRATTLAGYAAGLPFAVLGSLMFPLFMDPWIGAMLGGALPWLLFTWLGHRAGRYAR